MSALLEAPTREEPFVRLVDRPWPVHFIGDSHVLMFSDLLFEDPKFYHQTYITKATYCVGLTASTFAQNGALNPAVLQAMLAQGLLALEGNGAAVPSHLVKTGMANNVAVARGRGRISPYLVIACGDLDAREILLSQLPPNCDFILPDDGTDVSRVPPWDVQTIIPAQLIMELANRLVQPLFAGLLFLRQIGFNNLFLHSVAPPSATIDNPTFPVGLRYKCVRLINSLFRDFCAKHGVNFIDIWDDVTDGGLLDPEYFLDHVHLNKKAAVHTMNALVEKLVANYAPQYQDPNRELWALAYEQAQHSLHSRPGARDEEIYARFARDRITTIDLGREFAERMLAQAQFTATWANKHLRPDWCGNPASVPDEAPYRVSEPSKAFLDQVYDALYAPEIQRTIASCMNADWTILVLRVPQSLIRDPGPPGAGLHVDGGPPGVLRGILYLNDVDEDGGPFQYMTDDGRLISVTGPAGTLVLFDAERYKHRGSAPLLRARHVLDIVFCPLVPGDRRRVMFAGMNNWPIDPFQFTTDRFIISHGSDA